MVRPFMIGIAGGSASGKSTFSEQLKNALNKSGYEVKELHMDAYFKPEGERPVHHAPFTNKEYRDDNYPAAFDLDKLKQDLKNVVQAGESQIIIIEGLLTLWDREIYNQLDLRLFVECRSDERIVRRLKRNMQRGLTFDQIADFYLDMARYRHDEYVEPTKWRSDLMINGSDSFEKALSVITAYIEAQVCKQ